MKVIGTGCIPPMNSAGISPAVLLNGRSLLHQDFPDSIQSAGSHSQEIFAQRDTSCVCELLISLFVFNAVAIKPNITLPIRFNYGSTTLLATL